MPTPTLQRLFAYARQHQEQARAASDEIRTELWNAILDKLLDRTNGGATQPKPIDRNL